LRKGGKRKLDNSMNFLRGSFKVRGTATLLHPRLEEGEKKKKKKGGFGRRSTLETRWLGGGGRGKGISTVPDALIGGGLGGKLTSPEGRKIFFDQSAEMLEVQGESISGFRRGGGGRRLGLRPTGKKM